jgi:tetratricopeptide (TPR) repeat protein
MKRLYDQKEISRLLAISESQVCYWDRIGLIPHKERQRGRLCFDFKDLVAFRAVKELRDQGVSLRQIKRSVARLKKMLPDLEQPLSEARLSRWGAQLVISRENLRFTADGQLFLDLGSDPSGPPIPLRLDVTEELFFEALECEQEGECEEARRRYAAILAVQPDHLEALVNLGNILHQSGFRKEAAAHFRRALSLNPDHVEANYNLANLLEEGQDLENAILFYRKALHVDQEFADAYFNLARVLERVGDLEEARKCWGKYLELEPAGEWSEYIRKRLNE